MEMMYAKTGSLLGAISLSALAFAIWQSATWREAYAAANAYAARWRR